MRVIQGAASSGVWLSAVRVSARGEADRHRRSKFSRCRLDCCHHVGDYERGLAQPGKQTRLDSTARTRVWRPVVDQSVETGLCAPLLARRCFQSRSHLGGTDNDLSDLSTDRSSSSSPACRCERLRRICIHLEPSEPEPSRSNLRNRGYLYPGYLGTRVPVNCSIWRPQDWGIR